MGSLDISACDESPRKLAGEKQSDLTYDDKKKKKKKSRHLLGLCIKAQNTGTRILECERSLPSEGGNHLDVRPQRDTRAGPTQTANSAQPRGGGRG